MSAKVAVIKISRFELLGYLYGLGTGVCYGASTVVMSTAVSDHAPPFVVAAIAMAFGTIMTVPLAGMGIPRAFQASPKGFGMFALAGVTGGAGVLAILFGVKHSEVVVVLPLISVSPLITLFMARIFLRRLEKITITLVMGTLLVVAGTVLVAVGGTT